MTEDDVRCVLNTIIDPCSVAAGAPAGIAELGLLTQLEVRDEPEGAHVRIGIRLTDPVCMMGAAFLASAREALAAHRDIASAEVWLDERSDWMPDQMSALYRARLDGVRQARRSARAPRAAHGTGGG